MAADLTRVSPRALRLTFTYQDGQFQLAEQRPVEMVVTRDAPSEERLAGMSGRWVELQSANRVALHVQNLDRLLGASAEAFREDGTIEHFWGAPTETEFEIVVPDLPDAESVAFFAAAGGGGVTTLNVGGRQEVARFALRGATGGTSP